MATKMKAQEVAALLDKSIEMVRRYHKQGLLTATLNGRELLFDREEVTAFARSRGLHIPTEREVPKGPNFTNPRQAQEYLQNFLTEGAELLLRGRAVA